MFACSRSVGLVRVLSMQTNGDGVVSVKEFEENLYPATRKKIEEKLDAGWTFDAKAWEASQARHAND